MVRCFYIYTPQITVECVDSNHVIKMAKFTKESFVPATKEYEVLKRNANKLQRAITHPNLFSMDLFSENLIPFQILQKVNAAVSTSDALNMELIINLLQAVVTDPSNFHKLLQILENHPPLLTAVGKEMKEDYAGKCICAS